MDIGVTVLMRAQFPPLLREIPGVPKQLYLRGELPTLEWKWLAVVGSRAITPYGKQVCEHLINGLRRYPIVIVSGLALGTDGEAHKAALRAGLPTVAVPGSGLGWDKLYPRSHVGLAKEILASGGALLSEYEDDFKAAPFSFPERNRIMAGMCHATLIIEAKEKSGSLITARLATDYNRELLVVPGPIFSETSKGNHQFLKLGATPVTEPADILRALGFEIRTTDSAQLTLRMDVSPQEARVLALVATPSPRDDVLRALDMPVHEAQVLLSMMEIKGLIVEELGVVRAR